LGLFARYERAVRPSLTYVNRALSGRALRFLKRLKTDAIRQR